MLSALEGGRLRRVALTALPAQGGFHAAFQGGALPARIAPCYKRWTGRRVHVRETDAEWLHGEVTAAAPMQARPGAASRWRWC